MLTSNDSSKRRKLIIVGCTRTFYMYYIAPHAHWERLYLPIKSTIRTVFMLCSLFIESQQMHGVLAPIIVALSDRDVG